MLSSICACRRRSYLSILFIFFLNNYSLAVIYPIFTGLILHRHYGLLPSLFSVHERLPFLGLAMGAFPLFMLIGAVTLPKIARSFSNFSVFIITVIGIIIGFCITACGIYTKLYVVVVLGRVVAGFCAGNISLCQNIFATLFINSEARSRNFATLGGLAGISFIVAIIIGGVFSDKSVCRAFGNPTPFFITAALYLGTLIFFSICYKEHCKLKEHEHHERYSHHITPLLRNKTNILNYLIFFFLVLGWFPTIQFFATDYIERFHGNKLGITKVLSTAGLLWFVGMSFVSKRIIKSFRDTSTLKTFLFLISTCLILSAVFNRFGVFLTAFLSCVFFASIAWSICLHMVSTEAEADLQGRVLGMNQFIITLCMMIGPILLGFIGRFEVKDIYIVNSFSTIISFFILSFKRKKQIF
ncbi:MAG: hypothetical protein S4CHLAM37_01210 [Chlamydiia bacterium]|nr:hypothetical protein [Chlamydiia bacterium]